MRPGLSLVTSDPPIRLSLTMARAGFSQDRARLPLGDERRNKPLPEFAALSVHLDEGSVGRQWAASGANGQIDTRALNTLQGTGDR